MNHFDIELTGQSLYGRREPPPAVLRIVCCKTVQCKVYAVDVGYGQFDMETANQDERVVCMEKTNIRYVTPEDIGEPLDFASIDVSFISLTKGTGPVQGAAYNRRWRDGLSDQAAV